MKWKMEKLTFSKGSWHFKWCGRELRTGVQAS